MHSGRNSKATAPSTFGFRQKGDRDGRAPLYVPGSAHAWSISGAVLSGCCAAEAASQRALSHSDPGFLLEGRRILELPRMMIFPPSMDQL